MYMMCMEDHMYMICEVHEHACTCKVIGMHELVANINNI